MKEEQELYVQVIMLRGMLKTLLAKGFAYDRALREYGKQIDAGQAPVSVQGEDLDTLYAEFRAALDLGQYILEKAERP